jgi:hypothetical protein
MRRRNSLSARPLRNDERIRVGIYHEWPPLTMVDSPDFADRLRISRDEFGPQTHSCIRLGRFLIRCEAVNESGRLVRVFQRRGDVVECGHQMGLRNIFDPEETQ